MNTRLRRRWTSMQGSGAAAAASPTVAITSGESDPTGDSPFSVTITFSEEVSGFAVGDITVGNGAASNFATADNIVFTADITPVANGAVTVDVVAGVCTSAATGASNDAATQFSITYASLLNGLVSVWHLDEESDGSVQVDRADAVGSLDLTDVNTVASAPGKIGNAGSFSAGNLERLTHADDPLLSPGDTDFTFSVWVNLTTLANEAIISKRTTGNHEYVLMYNASDAIAGSNRFAFIVSANGSATTPVNADNLGVPSTGTWYLLVAWHDAVNDTINIQVNNGTVDSVAYSSGIFEGVAIFTISALNNGGAYYLNGKADEANYWSRVLTADERTDLWNGGDGIAHPF